MRTINKILTAEIRKNFWVLILIIFLMGAVASLDAIAPWPFKILIDNVLAPNPIEGSDLIAKILHIFPTRDLLGFFAVFVFFGSNFLLAIVDYLKAVAAKYVVKRSTTSFSKRAFRNLENLAIGFYRKQEIGDYIYRLSYDVSALGVLLEDGLIPFVTSLLYLFITACIMFYIDVRLTLLSFTALPFLVFGLYSFNTHITKETKRSEFFNSAAFSFIEEALTHLKIIQAFSQEKRESKAFDEKIETSVGSELLVNRLDLLLTLLVAVIIAVSYSVIIVYGIHGVFAGTLTTGLLIVFMFYLDNLTNPILSLIYAAVAIKESYVKVTRMDDFFNSRLKLEHSGTLKELHVPSIHFDHVTLVGKEGRKILDDLSFEIEAGKRTVIFGANGSGKTSVINLIMRFVENPTSGRVLVGGRNIKDYDIEALRERIAYVPQEITLFNDTIKHNISFGHPHSSMAEIHTAAGLACADEFIKKLPGGYQFKVGEAGNFLSGGQRQRLMLARALLKQNAEILLFDETLSALDVKSRARVTENIYKFSEGKTAAIVSNIFSVVSAADNVIVLNRGKLLYAGRSSKLPKEISLYNMLLEDEPARI